jgi:hypothetical protein
MPSGAMKIAQMQICYHTTYHILADSQAHFRRIDISSRDT